MFGFKAAFLMQKGSISLAIVWMVVISLVLFWLPVAGPLLAGFVGGRTAGSVGRGIWAAILPTVILCLILLGAGTALTGLPVIGVIASISLFLVIAIQLIPLIAGAIIGGLMA
ncbi:hypothetical protein [Salinisphaera japonica]|mgnify:CR=1 FL=1|uniref:ABC transporter permease n=1 Tax=Salinisphaera japonica YTM-1 TaxID=1209778 RepID=A0A423PUR3_9GAMM|nr:hypothetical protein [Salinisphaera japonica]ROO29333.1 hypothetical protein SAJA_06640 [Salinisphaera japonica YTM-1]